MKRVVLMLGVLFVCACAKRSAPAPVPAAPTVGYEAGKAALEAGKLELAESIFRGIVAAKSTTDATLRDNALLALASLRAERGDPRGALVFAQEVVAHRPDDDDALAVLVTLAHDAGDLAVEIATREHLVALDPDDLEQRLLLAGALTANKQPERAGATFLGYEEARTRIITALGKSPDVAMRRAAARALSVAHDTSTARALVLAMTDRDAQVRTEAVRAVTQVGLDLDPEIRPALKKLSTLEHDADVQAALRDALATTKPK